MNTPSTIELGKILSTYFRLTPDTYAREHFQNYIDNCVNSFDPNNTWHWLESRIQDDMEMIEQDKVWGSIPEGFNWDDFEPNWIAAAASELDYLSAFDTE